MHLGPSAAKSPLRGTDSIAAPFYPTGILLRTVPSPLQIASVHTQVRDLAARLHLGDDGQRMRHGLLQARRFGAQPISNDLRSVLAIEEVSRRHVMLTTFALTRRTFPADMHPSKVQKARIGVA